MSLSHSPRLLRALIVEVDPSVARNVQTMLEELQVEVVGIATSAGEVDALISTHWPDFVTVDVKIRGEHDGISAA